jgi:Sulfotransferase family
MSGGLLSMAAIPHQERWCSSNRRRVVHNSLLELAVTLRAPGRIRRRLRHESYGDDYLALLDHVAHAQNKSVWIEKTPNHVFYLDRIARLIPDARFIHLIRRGNDVVESCVNASISYPELIDKWTFCQGLPWFAAYWNSATDIHLSSLGLANHMIVFFEDLVQDLSKELNRVLAFIGCDAAGQDLTINLEHVANIAREPWKAAALTRRLIPPGGESVNLFGIKIREWLAKHLRSYDHIRNIVGARDGNVIEPVSKLCGNESRAVVEI